jgi:hypothetical protein
LILVTSGATGSTVEPPTAEPLASPSENAVPTTAFSSAVDGIVALAPQTVNAGEGTILIDVTMPDGYKLNDVAPFTAIWPDDPVAQIPAESRTIRVVEPDLPLKVPVTFAPGQTELMLNLTVYWCEGVNRNLCFVDRSKLVMPLSVVPGNENHSVTFKRKLVPPVVQDTLGG